VIDNILTPLVAEAARLETELRSVPAFRKLEAVRMSIASIRAAYEQTTAQSPSAPRVARAGGGSRLKDPASITSRITHIAETAMRSTQNRFTSSQILEIGMREGLSINSPKPQSVVASIMSHDKKFRNSSDSRGTGYGLSEWSDELIDQTTKNEAPDASAPEPHEIPLTGGSDRR
jgi:hypothetical protein